MTTNAAREINKFVTRDGLSVFTKDPPILMEGGEVADHFVHDHEQRHETIGMVP